MIVLCWLGLHDRYPDSDGCARRGCRRYMTIPDWTDEQYLKSAYARAKRSKRELREARRRA
jgi:hypothetical protein